MKKYSTEDSVNVIPEDKSYFCSELVASLYKYLGLLPTEISSSNYWPGSFSTETSLKLLKNAYLSPEFLINSS